MTTPVDAVAADSKGSNKRKEPPEADVPAVEASAKKSKPAKKKKKANAKKQAPEAVVTTEPFSSTMVPETATATATETAEAKEEGEIEDAAEQPMPQPMPQPTPVVEQQPVVMTTTPPKLTKKQRKQARMQALAHEQQLAKQAPVVSLAELAPNYFTPERWAAYGSASNLSLEGIKQEAVTIISHLLSWGVTPEYILSAGVSPPIVKIAFDRLGLVLPANVSELVQKRARKVDSIVAAAHAIPHTSGYELSSPVIPPAVPPPPQEQPAATATPEAPSTDPPASEQPPQSETSSAALSRTLADLENEKRLLLLARKSALKRKNQATAAAFANEVENLLAEKASSAAKHHDDDDRVDQMPVTERSNDAKTAASSRVNNMKAHRPTASEFLEEAGQNKVVIDLSDSDHDDDEDDGNHELSSLAVPTPPVRAGSHESQHQGHTPTNTAEVSNATNALSEKESEIRLLMVKIAAMEARKKRVKQKEEQEAAAAAAAAATAATVDASSAASTPAVIASGDENETAPLPTSGTEEPAATVLVEEDEDMDDGTPSKASTSTPPREAPIELASSEDSDETETPPPSNDDSSSGTPPLPPRDADIAMTDAAQQQPDTVLNESGTTTTSLGHFFSRYTSPFLRFPSLRSAPLPAQLGSSSSAARVGDPSASSSVPSSSASSSSARVRGLEGNGGHDEEGDAPLRAWVARKALGGGTKNADKRICRYEAGGGKCADDGCLSLHFKDYDYSEGDIRDYLLESFALPADDPPSAAAQKEKEALFRRGVQLKLDALDKPLTFDKARRAVAEYWEDEVTQLSAS